MLSLLNQKYPAPVPESRSIIIALFFGLFIGSFLVFFEPFDININYGEDQVLEVFFFGFISTLVLILFLFVLPYLLPKVFSDLHWSVKHQLLFYFIMLFAIATLNGLYTNYINELPFSWSNYWWMINRTFVLGGIPLSFVTLLDYHRRSKSNIALAEQMSEQKAPAPQSVEELFTILTNLKSEQFSIREKEFYFARAVGNYVEIFSGLDDKLEKEIYRLSLSSVEEQLNGNKRLIRCHRSYIVNLNKVVNISGNAQGLKLELDSSSYVIPVSRKYIPLVKQFFQDEKG